MHNASTRPFVKAHAREPACSTRPRTSAGFIAILAAALAILPVLSKANSSPGFDFDTGNAFLEVFIPRALNIFTTSEAPTPSDASIVLRITTLTTGAMFDAIAPYHPTAVGVHSRLGRRPAAERTQRNKNIAILFATYRLSKNLFPAHEALWRSVLTAVGLDPDDNQENNTTPIGIGNKAGNAWFNARLHDGMNQLGDEGGRAYNRQHYADYTGYKSVNTAYELRDPSRWQPLVVTVGDGIFRVQQFVTPQMALLTPYSYPRSMLQYLRVPPPVKSNPARNPPGYRAQADEVLAASADLDDERKAKAELFNNKLNSLGGAQFFISLARGLSLDEFAQFAFLTNLAPFDTAVAVWSEKRRYDAVRPVSAIRYLYGDEHVTAWGGPGQGTVSDISGNEWRSYLDTADHPEYPSGSASFCAAYAQAARRFLGNDDLGWSVPVAQGSSVVEPGATPAHDIVLHFATWTQFERDCGQSRLWGGVHFQPAIDAGLQVGHKIGDLAYEFVRGHIDGTSR